MRLFLLLLLCLPALVFAQCDTSLWRHVYHNYRLHVINPCTTATGVVSYLIYEDDGDIHIRIKLDSPYSYMLNPSNISDQYSCLVVEPICATTITYSAAVAPCTGLINHVYIPNRGEHVAITGPWVTDTYHGWNEIHPVTAINIIWPTSVATTQAAPPSLTVYPNPANKQVNFTLDSQPASPVQIVFLNELGQLAGQYQLLETKTLTVNTTYLPRGTYFYHLEQDGKELQAGKIELR